MYDQQKYANALRYGSSTPMVYPQGKTYQEAQPNQPPQDQQQGGGGMDPMQAYGMYQQFSAPATASSAGSIGSGASIPAGSGAGAGAGAGSSTAGAGMFSNPFTAIAAAILINEKSARNGGHRRQGADYWKDLGSGAVISQDFEKRWNPKLDKMTGGAASKYGFTDTLQGAADMGNPFNPKKFMKAPGDLIRAPKKLFGGLF